MVPLAPRGTSPPSGSMGRHLNPRPNAAVSNVNVPAFAVVIAAQSTIHHPLDAAYRAAAAVSPHGLYPQGRVRCEFPLHCEGGGSPCAAETEGTPPPVAPCVIRGLRRMAGGNGC